MEFTIKLKSSYDKPSFVITMELITRQTYHKDKVLFMMQNGHIIFVQKKYKSLTFLMEIETLGYSTTLCILSNSFQCFSIPSPKRNKEKMCRK